ncbi:hypothetical protein [Spirosoma sp.]|uniref:hypothetical protein n=1 Tax=Spirosoma sp. TaxID=1899569 RepID=UPI002621832D|nr:hypothetical protein [Spirosoma sp.]MCX6217626.1 hypothetical protein [Spirosoma sp.]
MTIQTTIAAINASLAQKLTVVSPVQLLATARMVYDQQEKGVRLFVEGPPMTRLTLDDSYAWQSTHILGRLITNRGLTSTFGTVTENRYDLSVTFVVAALMDNLLDTVLDAFTQVHNIQINEVNPDTIDVLRRVWLQPMDQSKSYDPRLSAVAIRYTLPDVQGITADLLPAED